MRHARIGASAALLATALACGAAPATVYAGTQGGTAAPAAEPSSSSSGGAKAPSDAVTGGAEYGVLAHTEVSPRPALRSLSVPGTAVAGRPPRVTFRIDEKGVGTVYVRISVSEAATGKRVLVANLRWVHTGRVVAVSWPAGATLPVGTYQVSVSAHDHHSGTLLRTAHSSGEASLTVTAPKAPAPVAPTPEAGVPSPAQSAAEGAVFPVAGAHSFGGPENRYGAARNGHVHEGQDVLTAEGTPVVAPLAGTILTTSYQAGGAGYYAVEHTAVGFDFMFAHCKAASLAVGAEQTVAAGQTLCLAGQTGDATGPHLHFEMWVGGWQAAGGHSIDPLPYLRAWEH